MIGKRTSKAMSRVARMRDVIDGSTLIQIDIASAMIVVPIVRDIRRDTTQADATIMTGIVIETVTETATMLATTAATAIVGTETLDKWRSKTDIATA
jgi:hypothetical protein